MDNEQKDNKIKKKIGSRVNKRISIVSLLGYLLLKYAMNDYFILNTMVNLIRYTIILSFHHYSQQVERDIIVIFFLGRRKKKLRLANRHEKVFDWKHRLKNYWKLIHLYKYQVYVKIWKPDLGFELLILFIYLSFSFAKSLYTIFFFFFYFSIKWYQQKIFKASPYTFKIKIDFYLDQGSNI